LQSKIKSDTLLHGDLRQGGCANNLPDDPQASPRHSRVGEVNLGNTNSSPPFLSMVAGGAIDDNDSHPYRFLKQ
jgi:hypothetical protein